MKDANAAVTHYWKNDLKKFSTLCSVDVILSLSIWIPWCIRCPTVAIYWQIVKLGIGMHLIITFLVCFSGISGLFGLAMSVLAWLCLPKCEPWFDNNQYTVYSWSILKRYNYNQRAGLFGPRHLIGTQSFMLRWKQSSSDCQKNSYNLRYTKNWEQYILGVAHGVSSGLLWLIKWCLQQDISSLQLFEDDISGLHRIKYFSHKRYNYGRYNYQVTDLICLESYS